MSVVAEVGRMDAVQFIEWSMRKAGRFELDRGDVWAMAPERPLHGLVKARIARLIGNAIAERGLACQTMSTVWRCASPQTPSTNAHRA